MKLYALRDRVEAGRLLAERLEAYRGRPDCIVVALPRGGVITAYEISKELGLPLDILTVRKLGVPGQPELAMGAIATGGVRVLNQDIVDEIGVTPAEIEETAARERLELERRERTYREGRAPLEVSGNAVILVDDGIATGATLRSAIAALKARRAARIVVAAGVAPPETVAVLNREVDEVVILLTPSPFGAISVWYQEFPQTTDQEVRQRLTEARKAIPQTPPVPPRATAEGSRTGSAR